MNIIINLTRVVKSLSSVVINKAKNKYALYKLTKGTNHVQ